MLELPIIIVILILFVTVIFIIASYIRGSKIKKSSENDKDWDPIERSIKESQYILGGAELEGVKIVSDAKFFTQKMEQDYKRKVDDIVASAQTSVSTAYSHLVDFMNDLEKKAEQSQETNEKKTEERVNALFEKLEQRLSDFLVETSQKTTSSIDLELKAARSLIETYKQGQIKLIDENILAMMEQTLATVLNKKLSLEEHLDLIYEALEKAKVEKFIV